MKRHVFSFNLSSSTLFSLNQYFNKLRLSVWPLLELCSPSAVWTIWVTFPQVMVTLLAWLMANSKRNRIPINQKWKGGLRGGLMYFSVDVSSLQDVSVTVGLISLHFVKESSGKQASFVFISMWAGVLQWSTSGREQFDASMWLHHWAKAVHLRKHGTWKLQLQDEGEGSPFLFSGFYNYTQKILFRSCVQIFNCVSLIRSPKCREAALSVVDILDQRLCGPTFTSFMCELTLMNCFVLLAASANETTDHEMTSESGPKAFEASWTQIQSRGVKIPTCILHLIQRNTPLKCVNWLNHLHHTASGLFGTLCLTGYRAWQTTRCCSSNVSAKLNRKMLFSNLPFSFCDILCSLVLPLNTMKHSSSGGRMSPSTSCSQVSSRFSV